MGRTEEVLVVLVVEVVVTAAATVPMVRLCKLMLSKFGEKTSVWPTFCAIGPKSTLPPETVPHVPMTVTVPVTVWPVDVTPVTWCTPGVRPHALMSPVIVKVPLPVALNVRDVGLEVTIISVVEIMVP